MRKILSFAIAGLLAVGCSVDLSPLEKRIKDLEDRMNEVEGQLRTLNTNATGLKSIVDKLEQRVSVTHVDYGTDGYTIFFSSGNPVYIKNGKDGQDGTTPTIGVKTVNGVIVWTVNGDPILDNAGKPIPVTGTPAVPEFKFEENTWYYKVGDGAWTPCGSGSGSSLQASIVETDNFVIITIGEESIALPKEAIVDPTVPQLIDKSKMAALSFPDDSPIHPDIPAGAAAVFDGAWPAVGNYWYDYSPTYHTVVYVTFPVYFGFDMGDTYKLSKMTWYPRHIFCCGHPRVFEVYGATVLDTTKPLFDTNGSLDPNWTKLATFESFRPSGLTTTAIKDAYQVVDGQNEVDVMFYGQDFTFPTDIPAVRYLRFRILEIWGDDTDPSGIHNTYVECNEISLYAVLN